MKMKSFAMLAASGLLAASLVYAAPVLADDTAGDQPMQMSSDSAGMPGQGSAPQDNAGASSDMMNNTGASSDTNASSSAGGSDEASPDTATGDDDY